MSQHELSEDQARGIAAKVYEDDPAFPFSALPEPSKVNLVCYVRAGYAAANLAEARREGAREALTRCAAMIRDYPSRLAYAGNVEEFRDREYPAPAPEAVTLSDGSVVTVTRNIAGSTRIIRHNGDGDPNKECPLTVPRDWRGLLSDTDTGADFDALKAFAAQVGAA